MNRRQLDAVSRGDGWHGIRASYALQLSVVLVLGSALFASVVLHVDWAGNPVRVLGRSVRSGSVAPLCPRLRVSVESRNVRVLAWVVGRQM